MNRSRIALFVVAMNVSLSYGMGHSFSRLVETVVQKAHTFVAWRNGEEQLLIKPEESPLPNLHYNLMQKIALNLDRTSSFILHSVVIKLFMKNLTTHTIGLENGIRMANVLR